MEELEPREVPTLLGNTLFPADNPWNDRITSAPVAGNSATLVSSVGASNSVHADFGTIWAGSYIGIPFNAVHGNTQPKINVVVDAYANESDLVPVPIPSGAILEGDPLPPSQNTGDRHLLVYDQDNNLLYEMFNASRPAENADGQWHCDSLAFWNMNQDSFRTPGFTSADAAGLPILPGLVRPDEVLDQKIITHALRFTVPRTDSTFVFPASHQAGVNNASLPRMGERFRLKSSFNISAFSPANQVILQALKDYGMIVADNGSSWYLSGEPSTRWDDNDLHALGQLHGSDFEALDLTPQITSATYTDTLSSGSVITIAGINFSGTAGLTTVKFGNNPAANIQIVSDTQILATVGTLPGGTVSVTVTSPYGSKPAIVQLNGTQTPQTPVLVSPTGTTFSAMPTFTWNTATGAATYDLWVDDTTSGQMQVIRNQQISGTSFTITSALAPGDSYHWWVRGINAVGGAGAWSPPGSFTIARLAMPMPVAPSGAISSASVAFSWSAVTGADTYDVWVDDLTTKQTQVLRNMQVTGTTLLAAFTIGHNYQWWVRALNASGNVSSWSPSITFAIALSAPALMAPSGSVQNAAPVFSWSSVAGAVTYDLWVDDTTTGQSQVIRNSQVSGTSWPPPTPLTVGHGYNWWVRATVPGGLASAWSSKGSFTVTPLGSVPQAGPTGSIANATPTFSWNVVGGADYYDVWVDNLTTGMSQVVRNAHATGLSFASAVVLTPGQRYQWWVRAMANNGDTGAWGAGIMFTVAFLGTPIPATPSGKANTQMPTFTWNAITGADFYDVWVDDATTGQSQVLRNSHAATTNWTPTTSLVSGHSYRWWVRALSNNADYSLWSGPLTLSV